MWAGLMDKSTSQPIEIENPAHRAQPTTLPPHNTVHLKPKNHVHTHGPKPTRMWRPQAGSKTGADTLDLDPNLLSSKLKLAQSTTGPKNQARPEKRYIGVISNRPETYFLLKYQWIRRSGNVFPSFSVHWGIAELWRDHHDSDTATY
jgi:hypothetical protein